MQAFDSPPRLKGDNAVKLAYSTLACPDWTVERAVQAASEYGYDGIEWRLADGAVLSPQTPQAVKLRVVQATRRAALSVACLDTGCQLVQVSDEARSKTVQDIKEMVDLATQLEAPLLRVFGGPLPNGLSRTDLLEPTAQTLRQAAEYAAQNGVKIVLETHDAWSHSADAIALVEAATGTLGQPFDDKDTSGPGILWDVHHPYRMGESPAQTLSTLHNGKAVAHVHIKDAYRRQPENNLDEWQLCLLERGEVPVKEIVRLLQAVDYKDYLSLEWEKKWHPEIEEPEVALPQVATLLRQYLST